MRKEPISIGLLRQFVKPFQVYDVSNMFIVITHVDETPQAVLSTTITYDIIRDDGHTKGVKMSGDLFMDLKTKVLYLDDIRTHPQWGAEYASKRGISQ